MAEQDPTLPVGRPADTTHICVQCATVIKTFQDVFWLGAPRDVEAPQFWGYFCSKTCMGVFAQLSEEQKLRTVLGEEAYLRLMAGLEANYYHGDQGDAS